jgi:hypothetical protein
MLWENPQACENVAHEQPGSHSCAKCHSTAAVAAPCSGARVEIAARAPTLEDDDHDRHDDRVAYRHAREAPEFRARATMHAAAAEAVALAAAKDLILEADARLPQAAPTGAALTSPCQSGLLFLRGARRADAARSNRKRAPLCEMSRSRGCADVILRIARSHGGAGHDRGVSPTLRPLRSCPGRGGHFGRASSTARLPPPRPWRRALRCRRREPSQATSTARNAG